MFFYFMTAQQAAEDKETHDRSSSERGSKAADRRIDIQPAEDEDGKNFFF